MWYSEEMMALVFLSLFFGNMRTMFSPTAKLFYTLSSFIYEAICWLPAAFTASLRPLSLSLAANITDAAVLVKGICRFFVRFQLTKDRKSWPTKSPHPHRTCVLVTKTTSIKPTATNQEKESPRITAAGLLIRQIASHEGPGEFNESVSYHGTI